jgi:ADP-ribose pyrophosphatase YjhB (NUDIX family)
MTNQPRHSVSVAVAVADSEGRVLVIKRLDNGAWQLPGGVLELNERIEDGVVREVLEETNVLVRPLQLTGSRLDVFGWISSTTTPACTPPSAPSAQQPTKTQHPNHHAAPGSTNPVSTSRDKAQLPLLRSYANFRIVPDWVEQAQVYRH